MVIRYEYKTGSGTGGRSGPILVYGSRIIARPVPIANKSPIKVPLFGDGYSPSFVAGYTLALIVSSPAVKYLSSRTSELSRVLSISSLRPSSVFLSTRRWNVQRRTLALVCLSPVQLVAYIYIRRKSRVRDARRRIRMRRPRTSEDGVGCREIYLKFIGSFVLSLSLRLLVHELFTLERNDRGI